MLDREARRIQLLPAELAEKLILERLSEKRRAWEEEFEGLLARVHARMVAFDPTEIEGDITSAAEEVKARGRASLSR